MTKSVNTRELVLGILLEVTREGAYSHITISNVLDKYQYLEKQERGFITRVTEGTLERMIEIDYIVNQFSTVKTNKMKPVIRNIIRSAVYQIKYMDSIPDSAVCNEAVKLAQRKGFRSLKGFVNGVLRTISREWQQVTYPDLEREPLQALSVKYSMPEWIVEDFLKVYDIEVTEKVLQAFLAEQSGTMIRCNLHKTSPQALRERLEEEDIKVRQHEYLNYAMEISGYDYIGKIKAFQEGLFQVQDTSSMLVAEIAAPEAGDYCIDVCAAPGGKSLHLADKLVQTGTGSAAGMVDARDLTVKKTELIRQNAVRTGTDNIVIKEQDATVLEQDSLGRADVLIADLPCSGLGVLRNKTDIKYKMTKEQQGELVSLQRDILGTVQQYVKEDGVLIYSTCTINQAENEENVRWFIEHYPFETVSLSELLPEELRSATAAQGYIQLLPGIHNCDGFLLLSSNAKFNCAGKENKWHV